MNESQVTRAQLAGMTPDEISKAYAEGRLQAVLLGSSEPEPTEAAEAPEGQLTRADLAGMTHDQINDARRDGKLNWMMGVQS